MHEEAVFHARHAEAAAALAWKHLHAEYTQDIDQVLATLATDAPLSWTLAEVVDEDDGSARYVAGTTIDEIRAQYEGMRHFVEIHGWEALVEIRESWYTLTHGVVTLKMVESGEFMRSETVTMFPIGEDGILGEVQVGGVGTRRDVSPAPASSSVVPDETQRRLDALHAHDAYVQAFRAEDVSALVAANRANGAAAIRNYLTEQSTVLNVSGAAALGEYYASFFDRYHVRDVQLVNRIAESWYVFAELHWSVEERNGAHRTLEFCTAETAPLDADGNYWVRTGCGTDPVEVSA
jgi:predicted SnoaL-like aldol condensation-catalyzing enzyme